jgi:hypothetical protein
VLTALIILLSADGLLLLLLLIQQQQTNQLIQNHMPDINARLTAIEAKIDEASTEITAELAKLREQLGNVITAEAEATLTRLETKSAAIADIIPNTTG